LFFLKKSKPLLKELIPSDYVDIHSHLLYGIDDGAQTFDDTLFLAKSMIEIGFSEFITTPHTIAQVWDNTREIISSKNDSTIIQLGQNGINVPFKSASEYLMDGNFVERFTTEPLLTLKENYVLVEMSYINPPIQLYDILFELQLAGYVPILAHPERYFFYHGSNYSEYARLKKAGCLFQLNLLSIVGYYGENVFRVSKKLLEEGMIDYVGSDIHHKKHLQSFDNKVLLKDLQPLKEALNNNLFFSQK